MGKRFKKGSIKYESTRARFERLIIHIFTAGSQKRSILTEKSESVTFRKHQNVLFKVLLKFYSKTASGRREINECTRDASLSLSRFSLGCFNRETSTMQSVSNNTFTKGTAAAYANTTSLFIWRSMTSSSNKSRAKNANSKKTFNT